MITERVLSAADLERLVVDHSLGCEELAGALVEARDVGVGGREHDRLVAVESRVEPVGHDLVERVVDAAVMVEAPVVGEELECPLRVAVAELGGSGAFDGVVLAPVVGSCMASSRSARAANAPPASISGS